MAINQNINPYQVGAVVVDNKPFLQFYQQQLAQRQAKESALDNYFRDLGKNITPSGMRNQDVEGLTKRTNEWRQFYSQNKDAILNPRADGGKAYTEYMSRFQDQLGYIDRSKNRLKTTDELGKLKLDPNRSYMLDDPTLIDKMHAHDLPLDDPTGKDLNLMEMATPPKPWSIKDQAAHSAYLTHQLDADKIPGQTQNLGGFKTMTPITHQFSNENLKVIGERSGNAYDMDRSLQFETAKLAKQVENDPARHDQLNSTFYRLYGHDMQTPRDMRIAQDILNENKKSIEYKPGEDDYGKQIALENLRFGHQRQLKKGDQDAADNWIVNYWNQRFNDVSSDKPKAFALPDPNHPLTMKTTLARQLNPDQIMMEALKKSGAYPDEVYVTDNQKLLPVFYKYKNIVNDKGKVIGTEVEKDNAGNEVVDDKLTKPLNMDQAYLSMGYRGQTKKELGGTMQGVYGGGKKGKSQEPKIDDLRNKYGY
jgi:hypothetical protein